MQFSPRSVIIRHAEFLRFLISGGTAFLVSIGVLYVATDIFGIWYLTSSVFAFISAFIVSFSMQKFWTFRSRNTEGISAQIGMSLLMAVVNLGVNTVLMFSFVEYIHMHYLFAQVCTAGLIAVETYFIYKYVIFKVHN